MIDLSGKVNAPAWKRVVEELSAPAPNDEVFLARLVTVLGQVASARQAVLFGFADASVGGDPEPARVIRVWTPSGFVEPAKPGDQTGQGPQSIEAEAEIREAAARAAETGRVRVLAPEQGGQRGGPYYTGGGSAGGQASSTAVLAIPVRPSGATGTAGLTPVVTLLLDGRSEQALQTTVALGELVTGYVNTHAAQVVARKTESAAATIELAATLIASVNAVPRFKGACMRFVNDLMRQLQADRVAVSWSSAPDAPKDPGAAPARDGDLKVVAISDTEHIDRRMAMVRRIETAMHECSDQAQPVRYPPAEQAEGETDAVLDQAVTHAHKDLVAGDASLKVVSLPLRIGERVFGVVTIESGAPEGTAAAVAMDPATIARLQAAMDLLTPVLRLRKRDDRGIVPRGVESFRTASAWVVGARHTVWKVAGIALIAGLVASAVVQVPYRIEAPLTLEPGVRRTVSIPFTGVVASVSPGIEAGVRVEEGQVLAVLDTSDLELSAAEARQQILEARAEAAELRRRGKLAESQQAAARGDQARARLDLMELRIAQASLRAPIAGLVISGQPKDLIGASVQQGDAIVEIAPADGMILKARVDDRDIGLVAEGQAGELATMAYPGRRFAFTVDTVVPLAQSVEGENYFEVRGTLDRGAEWMRPGMEGLAKFETGDRSLLGIAARRIVDQARLWLWW